MILHRHHIISILSAFLWGSDAYLKPCIYQADKCGYTLMSTYGYNLSELITAVNSTLSIPTLTVQQIPQVIFHCDDIYGNITGNSFCINGCLASTSLTVDDECQIASGTACPTTTTITITAGPPSPTCFKQCQTWCFGGPSPSMASIMHAVPTTVWM